MTKEEEAIKILSDSNILFNIQRDTALSIRVAIETVLNMLKENSAELAEKSAEIEKKDKEIDFILDKLNENYTDVFKNNEVKGIIEIYEKIKNTSNLSGIKLRKECIKQYFERKGNDD